MADIGFHLEALAKRFVPTFTKLGISFLSIESMTL